MPDDRRRFRNYLSILNPNSLLIVISAKSLKTTSFAPVVAFKSARACSISPSQYKLNTFPIVKRKTGQSSQDAMITLNKTGMEELSRFVSLMQARWPNLQCSQLRLDKLKGSKDLWKTDIRFTYYQ